jgi:hypothetical protein
MKELRYVPRALVGAAKRRHAGGEDPFSVNVSQLVRYSPDSPNGSATK